MSDFWARRLAIGLYVRNSTLYGRWFLQILDMGNDYFSIKFAFDEGFQKAILEGPWVIMGSYLLMQPWHLGFDIACDNINATIIWIRLPRLPFHLYHEKMLYKIDSVVFHVIKIDANTADAVHGKYARIVV